MSMGPTNATSYNPRSELSREEQAAVHRHSPSQDDYQLGFKTLMSLGMGLPDHNQVEMAAKILGAASNKIPGGKENPHAMWLMTETYMLLGQG